MFLYFEMKIITLKPYVQSSMLIEKYLFKTVTAQLHSAYIFSLSAPQPSAPQPINLFMGWGSDYEEDLFVTVEASQLGNNLIFVYSPTVSQM